MSTHCAGGSTAPVNPPSCMMSKELAAMGLLAVPAKPSSHWPLITVPSQLDPRMIPAGAQRSAFVEPHCGNPPTPVPPTTSVPQCELPEESVKQSPRRSIPKNDPGVTDPAIAAVATAETVASVLLVTAEKS